MLTIVAAIALAHSPVSARNILPKQVGVGPQSWVQQMVNLYYFPDPIVLAKTLNPEGGYGSPGADPVEPGALDPNPPKSLSEALGSHIDAINALERDRQAVADAKLAVQQATRAERDANKAELIAANAVENMTPKVEDAQASVDDATAAVTEADNKIKELTPPEGTAPTPEQTSQLRSWQTRRKVRIASKRSAENRLRLVNQQVTAKEREHAQAQEDLGKATAAKGAAEEALTTAQTTLAGAGSTIQTASSDLRAARARAQLAAADRLTQFQKERENAQIWHAELDAANEDPIKRVDIHVYPNSHTIFLRGAPEDVRVVREIIAAFDTPTPQARVTLWSLELNLIGNKGRNALESKASKIESPINVARERMSHVSTLFREAIAAQVAKVESDNVPELGSSLDGHRLARNYFYNGDVSYALGFNGHFVKQFPAYYYFTRWTLPDPAATTTLGESILVYVLGNKVSRDAITTRFKSKLRTEYGDWTPVHFMNELGMSDDGSDPINAYQLEITRALQRSALNRFIEQVPNIVNVYSDFAEDMPKTLDHFVRSIGQDAARGQSGDRRQTLWRDYLYVPSEDPFDPQCLDHISWEQMSQDPNKSVQKELGVTETMAYLAPAILWLREQFGVSSQTYAELAADAEKNHAFEGDPVKEQEFAVRAVDVFRKAYPTDQSNARIAAADEMLKRIMINFEDDLQDKFVLPALNQVKKSLMSRAISVGKIDRTSLIASNRYASRVEGNATAELDLAGKENLIDQALMLADLVTAAKGTNVTGLARKLQGFNQEPTSEYYAINSGTDFRVTPIFDPTGQALQFQFDHVKNTNVLDSDGTNPSLPRVDSHSASMMVQISNMEIRELTRFETNTKLGLPEKRWGGIPFLNSIYPLSEVPIIGWFSRTSGRDAVSQTSVIFAQNAMYPTIGDLGNLLSSGFGVPPIQAHR